VDIQLRFLGSNLAAQKTAALCLQKAAVFERFAVRFAK
jgi:hypothetical protein